MEINSFFDNKKNLIYDYINYSYKNGLNEEIIKEILETFLQNDELLANYVILKDNISAFYNLETNSIFISQQYIEKNSELKLNNLKKEYNLYEKDKLLIYLQYFTILHEIMHVYQWNKNEVFYDENNKMVINLYDYYVNFIKNNNDLNKLRLYQKNQHNYFIERQASMEALYILEKVSELEKNSLLNSYISCLILSFEYLGYQKNKFGSIYETYAETKQKKAFKEIYKENNIPFSKKLRYGLPLSEEEYELYFDRIDDFYETYSKILK